MKIKIHLLNRNNMTDYYIQTRKKLKKKNLLLNKYD